MRRRSLLMGVPVVLVLAACSGNDDGSVPDGDPNELVAQASTLFADAGSVAFSLSSEDVPDDVNGVSAAEGSGVIDAQEPKFAGTITGRIQGVNGTVDIIAIGTDTWAKLFTPSYEPMDLVDLGAPNPAMFFHPTDGLPSLLEATTDLAMAKQIRDGSAILTQVTGAIDAAPVHDLLYLGDDDGEYDITFGITEDGDLRTITLVGDFYGDGDSTYAVTMTDYGEPVDITEP
ncbi:LppX_LprAFG lipoprotein [Cumulibacter soli]|uniref:LppX_LprAFG lipoprotein n=1 Tax=Cumulibacter soli TaxID=2546344 RepID=UPI0014192AB9|nr:LppX_LprAFG lipoprotein [Cumulibacter soli]